MHSNLNHIFSKLSANHELISHSLKTAHLCWEALQFLPKGYIELSPGEIYLAGLLHDIGKTTWPPEMFSKPKYCLTLADRLLMDGHSTEGARIAKELFPELSESVIEAIATHHERPGGKGYPKGKNKLKNEALLLAACDVFCACTEERKYRKGILTINATLKIIGQFATPEIVNAVVNGQASDRNDTKKFSV